MTASKRYHNGNFVTHGEFSEFRSEVRDEFQAFRNELKNSNSEITKAIQSSGKTNWSVIIGGVSILLVIATMAAGLVSTTVSAERTARLAGDAHSKEMNSLRLQLSKEHAERIEEVASLDRSLLRSSMLRQQDQFSEKFTEFDQMLQREMRLLDTVLQREMGLHVDRLDALIEKQNAD